MPAGWLASHTGKKGGIGYMASVGGPVVAILTVRQGSNAKQPFAAQTSMLAGFIRYGRELGMSVYVVTPEGIGRERRLAGWRFDGKRWRQRSFQVPDVVYDRVPGRRVERTKAVQNAKAFLRKLPNTSYFGMDFFDKWQVHEAWADDQRVADHIPKTVDYRGAESIQSMLRDHPTVYVKPRSSSLGLGIVRITGSEAGPWRLSWRDPHGKRHDLTISDRHHFSRTIRLFTRGRPYLVQQGIQMIPYRGRLFDIRAAVQRNLQGEWQVTAIGIRLGFAKSIVTNMAAGAVARPLKPIVEEVSRSLGSSADELIAELNEVALEAAEALGDTFGSTLGEVGLDLAIDRDGHVWLFEANSKPLRTIFQRFSHQRMAEDCLRKPMEYAYHLAVSPIRKMTRVWKRGEIRD